MANEERPSDESHDSRIETKPAVKKERPPDVIRMESLEHGDLRDDR